MSEQSATTEQCKATNGTYQCQRDVHPVKPGNDHESVAGVDPSRPGNVTVLKWGNGDSKFVTVRVVRR